MKYFVSLGGREYEIEVDGDHVIVNGERLPAALTTIPGSPVRQLLLAGRSYAMPVEPAGSGRWRLGVHGEIHEADVVDERTRHIRSLTGDGRKATGAGTLKAPMPGLVVRVQVELGQEVAAGTPVIVLEAMKMENQLKAAAPARVAAVRVQAGQAVEKGQVLLEFADPA
jgi:pyruvate carboxylase subunit B